MKKNVFVTLPLKGNIEKLKYHVDGNALIESEKEIFFAVNPALARNLKREDEVKIIFLETKGSENRGLDNAQKFINELNEFNIVGAKINKKIIPSPFDISKTNFKYLFTSLIKELERGAKIFADVTFGPRPLAFLIFSVIQFA